MDINKEWEKVEDGKDNELSVLLDMPFIAKLSSKDPLEKIRLAILINAGWGLLIGGGYIIVLLHFPSWPIIICIGSILLVTLRGVVMTLLLYRKLTIPISTHTVLQQMERHYSNIRQWMNRQQWAGLLLYPVSITGGFMLGGSLGAREPIALFMRQPGRIAILLILLGVLVPVCFCLAKWMSNKAFGQYAAQLKANIDALKNEKG